MRARAIFIALLIAFPAMAKNGAFRSTKHGDAMLGPARLANQPRGSCVQCHDALHGSSYPLSLFAPSDNDLCFTCHAASTTALIYPGSAFWQQSAHARSPNEGNKCVHCHDPHGVRDSDGVIPAMVAKRDSDLCNGCHDGSPASDIAREFTKPYKHPIGTRTRHVPGESTPAAFASRHAECSDCHNVHLLDASPAPPSPPQASNRLAGVSRIEVANGGAGMAPTYIWRGPGDSDAREYEICFKCHSSYTTQIPGQSNLALLTNPGNASFHPIQAPGQNPRINAAAFVTGYDAQSLLLCTDCHSTDTPNMRGPHGSSYRYLLKKPSTTTTARAAMPSNDICFDCHVRDVYANNRASNAVQNYSRFGGGHGHGFHVDARSVTCYSCHETHGSALRPALIAIRAGGFLSYTQTANGASCSPSCHNSKSYTVSYPR